MPPYSRIEIVLKMKETGIVPVFYHTDLELCQGVARACYGAGIRVFEFTNRGDAATAVFQGLLAYCRKELPEMMLGIGSIVDAPTAALFMQMGADFIVSPLFNPEIARVCNRRKKLWIPGCGTLSEISAAEELGAEIVKVFPAAQVGGPGFLKAVKGPCPWSTLMPTGGIEPDAQSLKTWFGAGAHCVGIGSKMFDAELLKNRQFDRIEKELKNLMEEVAQLRIEN